MSARIWEFLSTKATRGMNKSLAQFFSTEAAGGMVMLAAAFLAVIFANSSHADAYARFLALPVFGFDLVTFTKDVLMAIFFLAVGMELKREMTEGVLSNARQRTLPLIAALGGILLPAALYYAVNHSIPAHTNGWAVPTATDIAFAICVLSLLGKRVPAAAKIFLLAIAIYDDLAAILIIAVFYSSGIALTPLLVAAAVLAAMYLYNRNGGHYTLIYLMLGAALWHFIHEAGIHTTVAGMLTGLMIPMRGTSAKSSPLNALLHRLHPWVSFAILPLFAFVSAGVNLGEASLDTLHAPLPLGIALALFLGKQLGIFGATFAAIKLGFAQRPGGCSWGTLYGTSIVAGIGFTMSLFIAFLAFDSPILRNDATIGILVGSLLSAAWGAAVLRWATSRS